MTPSKGLQQAMNDQIRKEFESAYIYLSMAAWMEDQNLPGFAAWLRLQAREESTHAMKIFDHLIDRGCRVELQPLAGPPTDFKSSLHIFQEVKKHEEKKLGVDLEEYLPVGSSALVAVVDDMYADRVDKAVTKATKRVSKAIDSGDYEKIQKAIDEGTDKIADAVES